MRHAAIVEAAGDLGNFSASARDHARGVAIDEGGGDRRELVGFLVGSEVTARGHESPAASLVERPIPGKSKATVWKASPGARITPEKRA
jgi:hypothetical protein